MMYESQYLKFYSCLGKFRRPPVEAVLKNSDSGGANGSLPFFVCGDSCIRKTKQVAMSFCVTSNFIVRIYIKNVSSAWELPA
jgi:hypothetical protein